MDLAPTAKDVLALLGLFTTECGGEANDDQQSQYVVAVGSDYGEHGGAGVSDWGDGNDGGAVRPSSPYILGIS